MSLKIDFSEQDFAPEDTPKAAGGTELAQKWLFDRLDPELKNYFEFIASRKRKLEDKPRLFWVHDLAQDPEVEFLKEHKICSSLRKLFLYLTGNNINMVSILVFLMIMESLYNML